METLNNSNVDGLERLENLTMADRVEAQLGKYFKDKGLKPGDSIPKEIEIAEALGVSRNVVREALSRFRMLGMVETKKKRGMIMAHPDVLSTLERVLDPYLLSESARKEIFELRLVLEMGLADLLYARINEKEIEGLSKIVEREAKSTTQKERVQCDIDFHARLYMIAGNDILRRFQKLLLPVFDFEVSYESKLNGNVASGKVKHKDLVEVLKSGSPNDFRSAMYEHLKPHFDKL